MLPVIGAIRPWADPAITQIGRISMHVPLRGFKRRSLDGTWSLEMFDTPDEIPPTAINGEIGRRHRAVDVDLASRYVEFGLPSEVASEFPNRSRQGVEGQ